MESALFGSGRPVVVVPYIQREPVKLDHIVCCWDGSATAARAIGDAAPLLAKAKNGRTADRDERPREQNAKKSARTWPPTWRVTS